MKYREYEIWHDEHKGDDKVDEYWHGIFFVPVDKKMEIIKLLKKIRDEHGYNYQQNIKFAGSLKIENPKKAKVVKNHLDLFSHLLIVREDKAETELFNYTQKQKRDGMPIPFEIVKGIFGCKFALFYIPDNHKSLNYLVDYASRVETTFRFGFKGGAHYLFSDQNPIEIVRFYFDGHEHHGRHIDKSRILRGGFRNYCKVNKDCSIDDRQIKDRDENTKMMINFVDIVLGAWVARIKMVDDPNDVLYPLKEIYKRLLNNKIVKNPNTRWYKSIAVSELEVINGKIQFPDSFQNKNQLSFPF